ncbi:Endoplasmic reticulum, stress-associated Ramp4 [Teratosphaeria destructans]|uniref:Stress-associated endoplasmic reticulum protein n=1 Tax=Teratosphaeria destructans TaxID=418781 RepID=A0A9W7SZH1_9PEZI|nr:Endoplasmic reticulum, stress-associated Ramp4 [Teratosphaeria destructans]
MAQTPQQRRANEQFAKSEAAKRGKPQAQIKKKSEKPAKAPVSRVALYLLLFVVCGGLVFELLRIIYDAFSG